MDDMVVACRGRALLCPLDPGKTEVIFIGRSRTPPLRDTIILLRTDKSLFIPILKVVRNPPQEFTAESTVDDPMVVRQG